MINKETNKELEPKPEPKKDSGFTDTVRIDVQAHLIIKDKDTNEIFVNKRG